MKWTIHAINHHSVVVKIQREGHWDVKEAVVSFSQLEEIIDDGMHVTVVGTAIADVNFLPSCLAEKVRHGDV